MQYDEMTLRQVAALIPCSEITLYKRCKKVPDTVPPFIQRKRIYAFPASEVKKWLSARDALRVALHRPWLRWLEAPKGGAA